jgi:AraC-like DNA-binding protein
VRVALDPVPGGRTEPEAIDAGFATLLGMLRLLVAPTLLDPLELSLRRERPRTLERFSTVFRAPIAFGAPRDVMTFRRSDLLLPTTAADAAHARRAERVASGEVVLWSTRVRDRIADRLVDGPPSERAIARELAVSTRALQVHLAREGTTYRAVLEGTREALARAYLGEGRMPVKWIASLLGFAHTSGFSRAFKQWTGLGPREFVLARPDALAGSIAPSRAARRRSEGICPGDRPAPPRGP